MRGREIVDNLLRVDALVEEIDCIAYARRKQTGSVGPAATTSVGFLLSREIRAWKD